jgi:hypothetical protein
VLPVKKEVIQHLNEKKFGDIFHLSPSFHKLTNILISLSYDKSKSLSWRAIEALGLLSREIAKTDTEAVRNLSGRLLWMIRDESGGIGWSSPEMLGEIVRNNPVLCADIAPIIVSFHEEAMLTTGVLWAVGRMGKINNETVGYAIPIVLQYLNSPSRTVRGYAAFALGSLGAIGALPRLEVLTRDDSAIDYYEDGELIKKTIGEIATAAISTINNG